MSYIRQCECCGKQFFSGSKYAKYCSRACGMQVTRDRMYLDAYPVIDLKNWKYQVRRYIKIIARSKVPTAAELLSNSRWDILITLITRPYPFWEKLTYEQMDYVAQNWIDPLEQLLELPAGARTDEGETMKVISRCLDMCRRKEKNE